MENKDLLIRLGLSKNEAAVYLALLAHGAQTVAEVAREADIERPLVYKAVPKLLTRGLIVRSLRGKRTYYSPASPEKLGAAFTELETSYAKTLPTLLRMFSGGSKRPVIHFYDGRAGIKEVYADILATLPRGGVFYRYSSTKNVRKEGAYVPSGYGRLRDAKKIERYVITNSATGKRKGKRLDRAVKVIPSTYDLFEFDVTELIYGPKIAFVDYNTDTAIVIENSMIADFQRKLFVLLFGKL